MIELLKPKVTVEQIHAEFDSAEERILKECDNILSELKIPTETKIERKADMLTNLGFVNSEVVKQAKVLKEKQKTISQKIEITSNQANYIRELKVKYPKEKFITVDELERICEKYNLIHAPVANYIKDIPEKNVLEMVNCKKLYAEDKLEKLYKLINDSPRFQTFLNAIGKPEGIIKEGEDLELMKKYDLTRATYEENPWPIYNDTWTYVIWKAIGETGFYSFNKVETIDKSGLFIAAPKSHFNLQGLNKKSKFGFFTVTVTEVKDPVVFEYCKNNICRIITKWGTEDDQSYLDPILFDEKLN